MPQTVITALGHTPVIDSAITATCETNGYTEGQHCGRCNTVLVPQTVITALGHLYGAGVIAEEATCNQNGTKKFPCTRENCVNYYTESYSLTPYSATDIYNQSVQYVGEITVYDKKGVQISLGTGFVISSDGKIVTNYHVIDDAYYATITINNQSYPISYILAYDEHIDLAILKINATGLPYANVCKEPVNVGEYDINVSYTQGEKFGNYELTVEEADKVSKKILNDLKFKMGLELRG